MLMERFFQPEYIPPYSSKLNGPIETVWSVLKSKVLKKFTKLMVRKCSTREACI
jgi:transposase